MSTNRCPTCDSDRAFTSIQGMGRHYVSAHEGMHVANLYVANATCPACLTLFWTRHRALSHFKNSRRCLMLARAYSTPYGRLPEVPSGTDLDELQRKEKFRAHGPLLRQYHPNGRILYRTPRRHHRDITRQRKSQPVCPQRRKHLRHNITPQRT